MDRRELLSLLAAGLGSYTLGCKGASGESASELIGRIEREVIWKGREGGKTWFHPRACLVPGKGRDSSVLMTCQTIMGSDVFSQVHWSETLDSGKTWTEPKPIVSFMRIGLGCGLEEGTCDVVPMYHPATGTILAIGHNVYYKDNVLAWAGRRYTVYVVRGRDGIWSKRKRLEWRHPLASGIYSAGCAQRINLLDGKILLPLSFGPMGRTHRSVCTALCDFDGETLSILETGNVLELAVKRGLLEPSLARFGEIYYMTIRAEDERGYLSTSEDGLNWREIKPWSWDDGEPLTMSTTQQRWLTHEDGLYLVYTRQTKENRNVMRWRAPLFLARVDVRRLCLVRESEQIVFPLIGDGINNARHVARMGNFHTVNASERESWVTVGETLPHDGWKGNTLMARIHWNRPNRREESGRRD